MNHRLLKAFCSDLDDDASVLLFHTDVRSRWLSRDLVSTRFFERRIKIKFLREQRNTLVHTFKFTNFAPMLAYLAEVFQRINDLNLLTQEKKVNTVTACGCCMLSERDFCSGVSISCRKTSQTSLLDKVILKCSNLNLEENVKVEINQRLERMRESFDVNFSPVNLEELETWIINPFAFKLEKIGEEGGDKEHFIEMQACQLTKLLYESSKLKTFWRIVQTGNPTLAKRVLQLLFSFVITWLRKLGFSSELYMKNRYRNLLDPENNLPIVLSYKIPHFKQIIIKKRWQEQSQGT